MAFQPDWRIDGEKYQYAIVKKLGEGGFGITYLAKRSDGKQVVIKTLNDEMQKNDREFNELQQKFIKEAFLLRGLNHPHIVKVLDICQSVNLYCMVMDYIDGGSLHDRIDKQGVLSEEEALRYIKQIGSALEYMHDPTQHEDPILHRDLKPQNVMLRRKPDEAILIDFGIAREFTPNKTGTHTAFGTDGFMPIEQIDRRRKRGAYTDVYGLAAILYYTLTKKNPPEVLRIKNGIEELLPPKQHNANVSEAVSKAILWGMKLEPKDRPQTVQKWLERLDIAKPVKPAEPPKKIPYRALAIGGWLYAINTFCLVFFHVLTWQRAKEMVVLFLLPLTGSLAMAIWLENKGFKGNQVLFPLLITGIVIGGGGGYLLDANLAPAGAFSWASAVFLADSFYGWTWSWAGAWTGAWFFVWSRGWGWDWVSEWSGSWSCFFLWTGAWSTVMEWATRKKWKWLEEGCFFLAYTPLGIPFVIAIIDMKDESFSNQKIFQITMGAIVLGLIIGGGLGILAR